LQSELQIICDDAFMETNPPTDPTWVQVSSDGAEIILNFVPVVGGALATGLSKAMGYKLNKRRDKWLHDLAEKVQEVSNRVDGLDPDEMYESDAFVDAVVTATRIADRTSQDEKLALLRNAVVNSVSGTAPDLDLQQVYFGLIDELTVTHLRMLKLLDDPSGWFEFHGIAKPTYQSAARIEIVKEGMPDLAEQGVEMIKRFFAKLETEGLVIAGLSGGVTGSALWDQLTSDFGKGFLKFLADDEESLG